MGTKFPRELLKQTTTRDGRRGMEVIRETNEHNSSLFESAQDGDKEMLDYFLKEHHCKVYTQEEIDLLNLLTKNGTKRLREMVAQLPEVDVSANDAEIALPDLRGGWYLSRLLGLSDLGEKYFLGRCRSKYEEIWCLKLDAAEGFKPLFNTLGW
jgi:hypothetical protein